MRTEVNRSLLLWPAVASAMIITASWMSSPDCQFDLRSAARSGIPAAELAGREWPQAPRWSQSRYPHSAPSPAPTQSTPLAKLSPPSTKSMQVAHHRAEAPRLDVQLADRSERGSRAMKLPSRLVEVFTVAQKSKPILAPLRDERQETAGLVLLAPRNAIAAQSSPPQSSPPQSKPPQSKPPQSKPLLANEGIAFPIANPIAERIAAIPFRVSDHVAGQRLPTKVSARPAPKTLGLLASPRSLADRTSTPDSRVTIRVKGGSQSPLRQRNNNPASWPVTQRLDAQLHQLVTMATGDPASTTGRLVSIPSLRPPLETWTDDVAGRLAELQSLPRIGHPRSGELIQALSDLASDGIRQAELMPDRNQQIEWLSASHAISRRVAVWLPIWQLANQSEPTTSESTGNATNLNDAGSPSDQPNPSVPSVEEVIEIVRRELAETGDERGWERYLLLDELVGSSAPAALDQRRITTQRFLSRLSWHGLDPQHVRWLDRESITRLSSLVRPWASQAVDYASLMTQIERQEDNTIDLAAIDIANAVQSLRFAENPRVVRVAEALNTHYRNANLRVSISESMLQRMLPTIEPQTLPVRMFLFGSKIRGVSQIESDLVLKLTPSKDRWAMALETKGTVHTRSTGFNGPAAVRTSRQSSYAAATPISITRRGVQAGNSHVDVRGSTKLRGIQTDYDGWPLIGSLVQEIAHRRYDSLAQRANGVATRKIRSEVGSQIDVKVDESLGDATRRFEQLVLGPFGQLRLDPKVIDLQTTDRRLMARYRLAGDWQLGAFTPRPRAPASSLMSLQVHQSALNNTLEQLLPRDQPKSIRGIVNDGLLMFGQTETDLPDDIPDDVSVQFANTRPITIEIQNGQLWVTLRIIQLTRGDRLDLRRFIVRAMYKPQIDGMQASLVRQGHLRISGPGMSMRERLPVRAIFNRVLSPNRPLRLTMPQLTSHPIAQNLAISQLELRHGWIAMAFSDIDSPRIALVEKTE